jgi:acyl carrier protein
MSATSRSLTTISNELKTILRQQLAHPESLVWDRDVGLIEAGLSSLGILRFLLAVEEHFDVEFPLRLPPDAYHSLHVVAECVQQLLVGRSSTSTTTV